MLKHLIAIVDFGLVVLIWLVQLIIYPAFARIDTSSFICWHQDYTKWITVVVAPLMFLQAGLSAYDTLNNPATIGWIRIALILAVWGLTFFYAVPVHNALNQSGNTPELTAQLVSVNWPRTVVWTLLFVLAMIQLR